MLRRWRAIADSYDPPKLLVGETFLHDVAQVVPFYGRAVTSSHLAFDIPMLFATFEAAVLADVVEETEAQCPELRCSPATRGATTTSCVSRPAGPATIPTRRALRAR